MKNLVFFFLLCLSLTSFAQRIDITPAQLKATKDVSLFLNTLIASLKEPASVILPEGEYALLSTIVIRNKTLSLIGGGGTPGLKTSFVVAHADTAIFITRSNGNSTVRVENISIRNNRNEKVDSTQIGIVCNVPLTFLNSMIENFRGDGLHLTSAFRGSDASFSSLTNIVVRGCRGNGIYIQGGDANQSNFYHVDVRDNGGYGIWDHSFLGNQFFGCMAHNNAKGHYRIDDPNSRGALVACYGEGDSPASYLGGWSMAIGGFHANGMNTSVEASWVRGRRNDRGMFGTIEIEESKGIKFGSSHGYVSGGMTLQPMPKEKSGPHPHWEFAHNGYPIMDLFGANQEHPAKYQGTSVPFPAAGVPYMFFGKKLILSGNIKTIQQPLYNNYTFQAGAEIWNDEGVTPYKWVCTKSGTNKTAVWKEVNL